MGNIASENIKPCNVGNCEAHNKRTAEYMKRINQKDIYVREDLTADNESWVSLRMNGLGLQQYLNQLAKMVKEKTGRAMQMKERERKDKKTGKVKKVSGCSALREGVVVCNADTTMGDLRRYTRLCHQRWGITAIQIHIHRDEGHYENPDDKSSWKPNYHAHIIWDWMDHETGKSFKLNKNDMSELQTLLAETLGMERGKRKEETGRDHLDRNDFILAKQRQEMEANKQSIEASNSQVQKANQDAEAAKSKLKEAEDAKDAKEKEVQKLNDEIDKKKERNRKLDKENGSEILSGVANLLGMGKYAAIEKENEALKSAIPEQKKQLQQQFSAAVKKEVEKQTKPIKEQQQKLIKENSDLVTNYNGLLSKYNAVVAQNKSSKSEIEGQFNWQKYMLNIIAEVYYQAQAFFRDMIDAIIDFAKAGFDNTRKHGSIFTNEEAANIKGWMMQNSKTKEQWKHVGRWLVDFAIGKGRLNQPEANRAYNEVNDIAEGKYDWRIQKGGQSMGRG